MKIKARTLFVIFLSFLVLTSFIAFAVEEKSLFYRISNFFKSLLKITGGFSVIDTCGTLDVPGKTYILVQNVSSFGTCFTIAADNIVLNCTGNTIFYASTTSASAIKIENVNNITIKNCKIIQNSALSNSPGILLNNSNKNKIENNSIKILGNNNIGILISNSNFNSITQNEINASGESSIGILNLDVSTNNNLTFNNITAGAINSMGISLENNPNDVKIESNVINVKTTYGIEISSLNVPANLTILNNTIQVEGTGSGIQVLGVPFPDNLNVHFNKIFAEKGWWGAVLDANFLNITNNRFFGGNQGALHVDTPGIIFNNTLESPSRGFVSSGGQYNFTFNRITAPRGLDLFNPEGYFANNSINSTNEEIFISGGGSAVFKDTFFVQNGAKVDIFAKDVKIKALNATQVSSLAPPSAASLPKWINVTNLSGASLFQINFSYSDPEVAGLDEKSIRIAKRDESANAWKIKHFSSSGMLSWWPGNGNANDFVSGFDGTFSTIPSFAPSLFNQAFNFTGQNEVVVPHNDDLNLDRFTISAWIKASTDVSDYRTIVAKEKRTNFGLVLERNFWFGLEINGGYLHFNLISNSPIVGSTKLNDSKWHHVAMSYDKTIKLGKIYVDGNLEKTGIIEPPQNFFTNESLRIGSGHFSFHPFLGQIDEVIIFNRVLSDEEIKALAHSAVDIENNKVISREFNAAQLADPIFVPAGSDTIGPTLTFVDPTPENNTFQKENFAFINITSNEPLTFAKLIFDGVVISSMLGGGTNWFINKTGVSEGEHSFKVYGNDAADNSGFTEERILTIDSTPPKISFIAPTRPSGNISNRNFIEINLSINETNFKNLTVRLFGPINKTNVSTTLNDTFKFVNFTNLPDGFYLYNATIYDKAGNVNFTETRNITLDATVPNLYFVTPPTPSNGAILNQNFLFINITSNENLTSAFVNLTSATFNNLTNIALNGSGTNWFGNITNLPDEFYTYKVFGFDAAGNLAKIERNVTIDGAIPQIWFVAPTPANGTISNKNFIEINVSFVEKNLASLNYTLFKGVGLIKLNVTNTTFVNFTNLTSAVYSFNVTIRDKAGNENSTETRTVIIDLTPPTSNITSPLNNSLLGLNSFPLNVSGFASDNFNVSLVELNISGFPSLFGTDFNATTGKWNLTLNAGIFNDGIFNLSSIAKDIANNTELAAKKISITVSLSSSSENSFAINSTATNSNVTNSTLINSSITDSLIFNSTLTNFSSNNCTIINSTLSHAECTNSIIIANVQIPGCGAKIVTNATLNTTLNCAGSALEFAKSNLTLNCFGHKINGTNFGSGISIANLNGITIKNCSIENFNIGIEISNSSDIVLENVRIQNNNFDFFSKNNSLVLGKNFTSFQNLISFLAKDVKFKGLPATEIPPIEANLMHINKIINATNTSSTSFLQINFSYSDEDVFGLNESKLKIFKFNGTNFFAADQNGVDATKNIVFSNITAADLADPLLIPLIPLELISNATLNLSNKNYKLVKNISCGVCFTIEAKNITLDCGGNKLTRVGYFDTSFGIKNVGNDYVTIKNCTIEGFYAGIRYWHSKFGNISNNKILNKNGWGIFLFNASNNLIEKNEINDSKFFGIQLAANSSGNIILNNSLTFNAFGIYSSDSSNLISLNKIENSNISDYFNLNSDDSLEIKNFENKYKFTGKNFAFLGLKPINKPKALKNFSILDPLFLANATGANASLKIKIFYNESTLPLVDENISIFKFFNATWFDNTTFAEQVELNVDENFVFANITSLNGIFALKQPIKCGLVNNLPLNSNISINDSCFTMGFNSKLNCDGFAISGPGVNATAFAIGSSNASNISVINCKISNFGFGLLFNNVSSGKLMANEIKNSNVSLFLANSSNFSISDSDFSFSQIGILLDESKSNNLSNLKFSNTTFSLSVINEFNNSISNSTLPSPEFLNSFGRVIYLEPLAITNEINLAKVFNISSNKVFVNSTAAPALNKSAFINLTGTFVTPFVAFDDEDDGTFKPCPTFRCKIINATPTFTLFNVTQFTSYALVSNLTLKIFDELDLNITKSLGEPIKFFANFSDASGEPAATQNGACKISFNTTAGFVPFTSMIFNPITKLFEYVDNFAIGNYTVVCSLEFSSTIELEAVDGVGIPGPEPAQPSPPAPTPPSSPPTQPSPQPSPGGGGGSGASFRRLRITPPAPPAPPSPPPQPQICIERWSCTEWGPCINGEQTRLCVDESACGTTKFKPRENQSCPMPECVENWICRDWTECTPEGIRTRYCFDDAGCRTEKTKPPTSEECVYVPPAPEAEVVEIPAPPTPPAYCILLPVLGYALVVLILFLAILIFVTHGTKKILKILLLIVLSINLLIILSHNLACGAFGLPLILYALYAISLLVSIFALTHKKKHYEPIGEYVKAAIKEGKTEEEIRKELKAAGHSEHDISLEIEHTKIELIKEYFEKALEAGEKIENIEKSLLESGWPKEIVEGAKKRLKASK